MKRSQRSLVDAILNNPKARMRSKAAVVRKLKKIAEEGIEKFMVISDFDHTLSRFHDSTGQKCWTTHGVFDAAAATMKSDLGARFAELKQKYLPIEFDPDMPVQEKIPHMEKWWRTAHEKIIQARFTKQAIETFVHQSKIVLRDDADVLISSLHSYGVPLIVFSAGIGNVIEIFLKKTFGCVLDNIRILSNMMEFDNDGVITGFKEPLIHTFCKNSSVIRHEPSFFQGISGRSNVLLMGDSLGDLHMDIGVVKDTTALKIGFLNFDFDLLINKYLDGYDIVLTDDQSMDVARQVLDLAACRSFGEDIPPELEIRNISSTTSCRIEAVDEDEQRKNNEGRKQRTVAADVKA